VNCAADLRNPVWSAVLHRVLLVPQYPIGCQIVLATSIGVNRHKFLALSFGLLALFMLANGINSFVTIDVPAVSLTRAALDSCPLLADDERFQEGRFNWWPGHSQVWRAMEEPTLACGLFSADEAYRLTWVHSFTHLQPFVIRILRSANRVSLVTSIFEWVPGQHRPSSSSCEIGTTCTV
jgi:hypothetical protein